MNLDFLNKKERIVWLKFVFNNPIIGKKLNDMISLVETGCGDCGKNKIDACVCEECMQRIINNSNLTALLVLEDWINNTTCIVTEEDVLNKIQEYKKELEK